MSMPFSISVNIDKNHDCKPSGLNPKLNSIQALYGSKATLVKSHATFNVVNKDLATPVITSSSLDMNAFKKLMLK